MAIILNINEDKMDKCTCHNCQSEIGYFRHELQFMERGTTDYLVIECPVCSLPIILASLRKDIAERLINNTDITSKQILLKQLRDKNEIIKLRRKYNEKPHPFSQKSDITLAKLHSKNEGNKYIILKDRYRNVKLHNYYIHNIEYITNDDNYKKIEIIEWR